MINSNDTISNQNPHLPVCSAVPQPTAALHAPLYSKAGQQNPRTTGDSKGMCAVFLSTSEGSRGLRLLY